MTALGDDWTWDRRRSGMVHIGAGDHMVAYMARTYRPDTIERQNREANLICAAPKMLEALIASRALGPLRMEIEDCMDSERPYLIKQLREIEDMMEAVISKATGEKR